ncbi:peptidoglycan-binding protein [Pedobacter frigoris]|uniref:peptidoglycan-binding protein n=1 Tax=Pedobacter frigoris TaxID=2571272 RepID=UPI002931019F|nr:peptidoglycan-binding protein [Pedobacter frigoris]
MGAGKGLFWAVCIVCFCGSRGYCSGVVRYGTGSREIATGRSAPRNDAARIIEIARKEIGVVERTGKNDGARIAEYIAYCNIKSPAPYCAAWVSWCFGQAGYLQPRTAWSPALFPKERLVIDSSHALNDKKRNDENLRGCVAGIYFSSLKRVAHCGIVEAVRNDWCTLIEGNTNVKGSRDGDGVWRRIRHKRTIHCFADWVK